MARLHMRRLRHAAGIIAFALMCALPGISRAQGRSGAVYVLTNQSTGNAVLVFRRAPDGTLSFSGKFLAGGKGTGTGADPLGSQGSLVLGRGHRLLIAVNAGSNEVSVFAVDGLMLQFLGKTPSGGTMPVSISIHGRLAYVLNAAGTPNITGFRIDPVTKRLVLLPGSSRRLAGGVGSGPAQVSFSPDGSVLMVTEKNTNKIDTYTVNDDGYASAPIAHAASGTTPFGFTFIHGSFALVSEAGSGALSSYEVDDDGDLEVVTASLSDTQKAGCWVVTTEDGRFAYVSNTGSGTISSFLVSRFGSLSLIDPAAATTGSGSLPIDMALSNDSRFLYFRDGLKNTLNGFRVGQNGSLTPVGSVGGIPPGSQGIAAR